MSDFACGTPNADSNLFIIGIMQGGRSEEHSLHKQFDATRLNGEWFKFDRSITDFIRNSAFHNLDGVSISQRESLSYFLTGWHKSQRKHKPLALARRTIAKSNLQVPTVSSTKKSQHIVIKVPEFIYELSIEIKQLGGFWSGSELGFKVPKVGVNGPNIGTVLLAIDKYFYTDYHSQLTKGK